ncbi:hypothetical protein IGI04_039461 [Brassica rapa subsp. trilocularis]|uniref:Leucine-rich repeat-containing N-terminal plant-type domain-containing protein n=1 Tax=Brassica rapa subsp. trilocularis TaxID=1813537 RepID=A0ABQ7KJX7_BRACM|nr:hypothetical protein IGI04_039461 [Brassica rapa subsp. trilocularis]
MMTLRLRVDSISRFFCCVFSLSFLVTTLVSQPFRRPDQVETLLAFKNEFSICNNSTTSSWSEDAVSFDGVVFDDDTGAVTDLHLGAACLSGNLKANSSLYRFQHLRYLDLSSNDFSSSFPAEFGRLTSLEVLDLHHNRFTGEVPSSISNLSRLTSLDLSVNKLTGGFPLVHNLTKLSSISLSYNNFSGTVPSYLFTMPLLSSLDLRQNNFGGPLDIPNSTIMFESLVLGNNIFSGGILEPISNLVNLIYLDLSFLNITFPVNFTFLKLQSLENLDISGNSVSRLNISSENAFPTMLIELHLSSCNIHEFPKVLKTLQNLQHLDISNNSLKGKVPACSPLLELDLSSNAFHGAFPVIPRSMEFISASNNHFSGGIPRTLCDSIFLNVLDLSSNSFSGAVPGCLSESLQVLNLSNNNLVGELPDIFYGSGSLTTVDVGHNQISGELPRSLRQCTALEILDVESNLIADTFPLWLNVLPVLKVIVLRSNRFYGPISSPDQDHRSFPQLRIIDISHNKFTGSLPPNYFVNWSAPLMSMPEGDHFPKYMVHLGYKLPNYFMRPEGARRNTYLLDIGWPSYFSMHLRNKGLNTEVLTFLGYINMSHNKLTGQIPQSPQIEGQARSSFEGNIDLCGRPLKESCSVENEAPSPKLPKQEHMLNWKAVAIGYGPGVLFGIAMGHTTKPNHTYQFSIFSCVSNLFFPMMKVHLPVFSMTSLFWCVFVSIFLVNTLVSVPFPLPNQIEILLAFKKEFLSPTCSPTVLSSWTKNTRSFDGVVFDNEAGVVTELHLSEACLKGTIKNNSNLFKFHHLRYLDLSYNHFEDSFPSEFGNHFEEYSFPSEFGGLANLEFLNFRYSGLVGEVPLSIHNLSRLTFLDLSQNDLTGGFPLIYNLSKLSYLNLSYNNFIGTIPSSLLTMPSLLNLDLRQNGLRDPPENLNSSSSSKLERLYLGGNLFSGRILEPISKLVKLTSLDLSFLNMIYPINIVFLPLKSLEYLDLSGNTLSRLNTSSTDHALPKLVELKLSYCNIFEFPKFLMTLQSLEYLDLSWNNLLRLNTSSDHALTKLIELNLSNCSISEFPNLSKTLNLQHLDISNNRLKGKVPAWLWTLPVTRLSLYHNSLNGFEGSREVLLNSSLEILEPLSIQS